MILVDTAVRANCSGERDDIKDGFGTISEEPSVLGTISINADRDAEHEAVVQVVQDGTFAVLE